MKDLLLREGEVLFADAVTVGEFETLCKWLGAIGGDVSNAFYLENGDIWGQASIGVCSCFYEARIKEENVVRLKLDMDDGFRE